MAWPNAFTRNYPVWLVGVEIADAWHDAMARPDSDDDDNTDAMRLLRETYSMILKEMLYARNQ